MAVDRRTLLKSTAATTAVGGPFAGLARFGEEFAGPTFSPDGRTLFVNIQASRGLSFAIWGPWPKIGV